MVWHNAIKFGKKLQFLVVPLFASKVKIYIYPFLSIFVQGIIPVGNKGKKSKNSLFHTFIIPYFFFIFRALWCMIFVGGLIILGTLYNICINKYTLSYTNPRSPPLWFYSKKKPRYILGIWKWNVFYEPRNCFMSFFITVMTDEHKKLTYEIILPKCSYEQWEVIAAMYIMQLWSCKISRFNYFKDNLPHLFLRELKQA